MISEVPLFPGQSRPVCVPGPPPPPPSRGYSRAGKCTEKGDGMIKGFCTGRGGGDGPGLFGMEKRQLGSQGRDLCSWGGWGETGRSGINTRR